MCAGAQSSCFLHLFIILVFGTMFEDAGEFCVVEVALFVDGRLTEQLIHFFVCEAIAHGGQQLPQMVLVDHTRSLLIEAGEGVADDVLGVRSIEPLSKHGEEHCEVDGPWCFAHHPLQVVVRRVLTQRGQHVMQILLVNETVSVLVDHVEGLFELLDLRLVEHGEHVRGGPLRALLGGLPLGTLA